jgi:hypothetical protein
LRLCGSSRVARWHLQFAHAGLREFSGAKPGGVIVADRPGSSLDAHRGVMAEAVDVGTQGLACRGFARHRAPQGQHFCPARGPNAMR